MVGVTRIFGVRTQRGLISAVVGTVRTSPMRCLYFLLLPDSPRDACTSFTTRRTQLLIFGVEKDSEQSVAKRPCCLYSQASRVYLSCETLRASALELSELSLNLKPQRFIIIKIFVHRHAACRVQLPAPITDGDGFYFFWQSVALAMLLCISMLPHDTVLVSVPAAGALGGGDGSPAEAYDPADLREGMPMPFGARKTPASVEEMQKNLDAMVSGIENQVRSCLRAFFRSSMKSGLVNRHMNSSRQSMLLQVCVGLNFFVSQCC